MLIPNTTSLINKNPKSPHNLKIEALKGDNLAIIYVFNCGCELPSDYDHYYPIKKPCGRHTIATLKEFVLRTDYWDLISYIC